MPTVGCARLSTPKVLSFRFLLFRSRSISAARVATTIGTPTPIPTPKPICVLCGKLPPSPLSAGVCVTTSVEITALGVVAVGFAAVVADGLLDPAPEVGETVPDVTGPNDVTTTTTGWAAEVTTCPSGAVWKTIAEEAARCVTKLVTRAKLGVPPAGKTGWGRRCHMKATVHCEGHAEFDDDLKLRSIGSSRTLCRRPAGLPLSSRRYRWGGGRCRPNTEVQRSANEARSPTGRGREGSQGSNVMEVLR